MKPKEITLCVNGKTQDQVVLKEILYILSCHSATSFLRFNSVKECSKYHNTFLSRG